MLNFGDLSVAKIVNDDWHICRCLVASDIDVIRDIWSQNVFELSVACSVSKDFYEQKYRIVAPILYSVHVLV